MSTAALLSGKRIAVLGSTSGLGLALARLADAAGAEVHGIDSARNFEAVAAFYQADLRDPQALEDVAHSLPEGLDGIALLPAMPQGGPREVLELALLAPRLLAEAVAPRLAGGASILLRGAPVTEHWPAALAETRAAMALRHDGVEGFIKLWGLTVEPQRASRTAGWALLAWAAAHRWTWAARDIRINALTPASPDGHLPSGIAAARGHGPARGTHQAAQAALFLLSDLSAGMTGATLATDGGLSAQMTCRRDGL